MANEKKEPILTVRTPEYGSPEGRREVEVIVKKCFCHAEHHRRLDDFDKNVNENKEAHRSMWENIRTKVPNRLFYLFISIVVIGLAFVYNGIHNVDKNLAIISTKVDDQKDDIRELKIQLADRDNNPDFDHNYKPRGGDVK